MYPEEVPEGKQDNQFQSWLLSVQTCLKSISQTPQFPARSSSRAGSPTLMEKQQLCKPLKKYLESDASTKAGNFRRILTSINPSIGLFTNQCCNLTYFSYLLVTSTKQTMRSVFHLLNCKSKPLVLLHPGRMPALSPGMILIRRRGTRWHLLCRFVSGCRCRAPGLVAITCIRRRFPRLWGSKLPHNPCCTVLHHLKSS